MIVVEANAAARHLLRRMWRRHAEWMIATVAHIFVLALAAAIYPTLLAGVILILTRPHPRRLLAAFLVGGMLTSVTIGLVLLLAFDGTDLNRQAKHAVGPGVDIAAGVLGLVVALLLRRRYQCAAVSDVQRAPNANDGKPSLLARALARDSIVSAFMIGVVLNVPGIWYLDALKEISYGNYGTGGDIALVLGFNLVMFALVEIPLLGFLFAPDQTRRGVDRFDAWLRVHVQSLAVGLAGLIGSYLIARGVIATV